jgi:hypothetical protein
MTRDAWLLALAFVVAATAALRHFRRWTRPEDW